VHCSFELLYSDCYKSFACVRVSRHGDLTSCDLYNHFKVVTYGTVPVNGGFDSSECHVHWYIRPCRGSRDGLGGSARVIGMTPFAPQNTFWPNVSLELEVSKPKNPTPQHQHTANMKAYWYDNLDVSYRSLTSTPEPHMTDFCIRGTSESPTTPAVR
jgi:hypothetical protein